MCVFCTILYILLIHNCWVNVPLKVKKKQDKNRKLKCLYRFVIVVRNKTLIVFPVFSIKRFGYVQNCDKNRMYLMENEGVRKKKFN